MGMKLREDFTRLMVKQYFLISTTFTCLLAHKNSYKPHEEVNLGSLDPPTNNIQHMSHSISKAYYSSDSNALKLGLKMVLGWLLAFEDNKCHKDIKKRVHLRKAMIKPKV
jgi:hypothetical protein